MPNRAKPSAPEKAAPPIVATFFEEFVVKADKEYAILGEHCETSLFDFRMEVLVYGLHCLDRAVFTYWGAAYRAAFMNSAFSFACEMFTDELPDAQREIFLEGFKKQCDTRHFEYAAMKPISGEDETMKNLLPWEFTKRVCNDAGVFNPPVHLVLMEWAAGIMTMMLRIAEEL
jgi:hypothetical protein